MQRRPSSHYDSRPARVPIPDPRGRLDRGRGRGRRIAAVLIGLALMATGAACSSSDASSVDGSTPSTVSIAANTVLIDVRTPQEFASGHLEGAVNIDAQAEDFRDQLAALDPQVEYFVYCRSGNRSAAAIRTMTAAGFTDLTDLGSVEEASRATGRAVVK